MGIKRNSHELEKIKMDQRERLIGRHNQTYQQKNCRSAIGFVLMVCLTVSLVIGGLVLTGQAKTAAQMLSGHVGQCVKTAEVQIIAHRGSSGMMPAHSSEGYKLAARQGADFIECDLAVTKDHELVCLHDPFLTSVTNIESIEKFKDRKRVLTFKNEEIDDWWVTDFTFPELLELSPKQERLDRDQSFNGKFRIPSFVEYMQIARDSNVKIYPETKTPQFYAQLTGVNMEKMMVDQIRVFGFH